MVVERVQRNARTRKAPSTPGEEKNVARNHGGRSTIVAPIAGQETEQKFLGKRRRRHGTVPPCMRNLEKIVTSRACALVFRLEDYSCLYGGFKMVDKRCGGESPRRIPGIQNLSA